MAGIYLHIPFCKQACHYCDFHFSTRLKGRTEVIQAMLIEATQRNSYLAGETVQTIYFGGGTPSLLTAQELSEIFDHLHQLFTIAPDAEITLEANPDDLKPATLQRLKDSPVNRLSIGLQSFHDRELKQMNRAHNSEEAKSCVKLAQDLGLQNISIDLIYGMPDSTLESWHQNLDLALAMQIPHLSAYALTVEEGTALHHMVKKGTIIPASEEVVTSQYHQLVNSSATAGLIHYEISNFGREGLFSKHNTSYWEDKTYLGLGPSAHSFRKLKSGGERSWNVANNQRYVRALQKGETFYEKENLDLKTSYNEYILTRMRTMWGCSTEVIRSRFGRTYQKHLEKEIQPFLSQGKVNFADGTYTLTDQGRLFADHIAASSFMI